MEDTCVSRCSMRGLCSLHARASDLHGGESETVDRSFGKAHHDLVRFGN